MPLLDDLDSSARWIARALTSSGYRADFSAASLWEIDRFFDEQTKRGRPRRFGLLSADLGGRMFSIGAYVGEVLRLTVGGTWQVDDDDPQGEVNVRLDLPEGTQIWPVQRAMKRLTNGAEDGIAAYGAALGAPVGPRPAPPDRRWAGRPGRHA